MRRPTLLEDYQKIEINRPRTQLYHETHKNKKIDTQAADWAKVMLNS